MKSGIYVFENKVNGKRYVGQSTNISRRYNSHKNNHLNPRIKDYETKFYRALRKYGFDNFDFDILEITDALETREAYWIEYYSTFENGYNSNSGGKVSEVGEKHPMSKLTNDDVFEIASILKNTTMSQKKICELYGVTQSAISDINTGKKWSHLDLGEKPLRKEKKSERAKRKAILTDEEVMSIRTRYQVESARDIYEDYKNKCSYVTIERCLSGRTYVNFPIYSKKQKKWIQTETCIDYP